MAPELRDLLNHGVQNPPVEPHHVGDVVHRAQRARRRRRVLTVGASATAVLAVAGLGFVVSGALPGTNDAHPAGNGIVGPVAHLAQATPGVAGNDYTVGTTYTNHSLDAKNGRLYQFVTDRGEVVVSQSTLRVPGKPMTEYTRYALLDPTTGRSSWLPAPPNARYSTESAPSGPEVHGVSGDKVIWTSVRDKKTWEFDIFDRGTDAWQSFSVDVRALAPRARDTQPGALVATNGRIYFTVLGMSGAGFGSRLWSVPLGGSAQPRSEGKVGDWAIDGTTLAYTEATNKPIAKLTVRDLVTGKETSFDPQSGDRCNQLSLAVSGDRIALGQYCGTHHKVRDDRVQVVTTSGEPVVTLQDNGLELAGLGDSFFAGAAYGATKGTAGTYVYDFSEKRLVRIASGLGKFTPTNAAGGDALTWGTPVNHHHGMKLWAGTWR